MTLIGIIAELRERGYEVVENTPGSYYLRGRHFTGFMGPTGLRAFRRAMDKRAHVAITMHS